MKVLIIEDDNNLAETIRTDLVSTGNVVEVASDGANGSFLARTFDYDAIILDFDLPKKDGLTVCEEIRSAGRFTPVLFLTVNDAIESKVAAFDRGADDYLTKPFSLQELNARLKALNRRPVEVKKDSLQVADLKLDSEKHVVRRGREIIHLTRKEFSLLEFFMKNIGVVLSRALIMEHVWTADSNPFSNTVEAHIRNLRKKINLKGRSNLIANVPGRGYVIDNPENIVKTWKA